jgi:hypothetical protein
MEDDPGQGERRLITLQATEGVRIDVRQEPDGAVVFMGSDVSAGLRGYDYEYEILPAAVPSLRAALGGADGADVLALIDAAKDEILAAGEIAWLRAREVEGTFSSRMRS